MEAALAELAMQNLEPEPEDDDDFAGPEGGLHFVPIS